MREYLGHKVFYFMEPEDVVMLITAKALLEICLREEDEEEPEIDDDGLGGSYFVVDPEDGKTYLHLEE